MEGEIRRDGEGGGRERLGEIRTERERFKLQRSEREMRRGRDMEREREIWTERETNTTRRERQNLHVDF